jgi:Niemann-Pick C1 protein
MGLLFSPLMSVLPFVVAGIGVDAVFVLQSALDLQDRSLPLEERMGRTLQYAGVSVSTASLTNFFAFLIGSNTSLPALSAFSKYAAFAILFDLLLQVHSINSQQ